MVLAVMESACNAKRENISAIIHTAFLVMNAHQIPVIALMAVLDVQMANFLMETGA